MSEFPARQPEADIFSGLEIIRNEDFKNAVTSANYELNAYPEEKDWRLEDIQEILMSHFPNNIFSQMVDFTGMAYMYDEQTQTKILYALKNVEFQGVQSETIKGQEKVVFRFFLRDSDDDPEVGTWFDAEPTLDDIAVFEFHDDPEQKAHEVIHELSKQAQHHRATVRGRDFLNSTYKVQQDILADLSNRMVETFEQLSPNSQAILGIECTGYFSIPFEFADEFDWDECYIDLGDNPDVEHWPEGRFIEIGLAEQFLNSKKLFKHTDDFEVSGGRPFIILKPAGRAQWYCIDVAELGAHILSIDTKSSSDTEVSE